jgi:hypothetical protein
MFKTAAWKGFFTKPSELEHPVPVLPVKGLVKAGEFFFHVAHEPEQFFNDKADAKSSRCRKGNRCTEPFGLDKKLVKHGPVQIRPSGAQTQWRKGNKSTETKAIKTQ